MKFSTSKFGKKDTAHNETLFTIGNGNLGFRGDTEEKEGTFHKGTYINGFYDTEEILYGEKAFGYAKNHETILNLPDSKRIELFVDDEKFTKKEISNQFLEMDEETGILTRNLEWEKGEEKIHLETKRMVSFVNPESACIKYEVTNTAKKSEKITIISAVDTTASNILAEEDPRIGAKFRHKPLIIDEQKAENNEITFKAHTQNTKLKLEGKVTNIVETGSSQKIAYTNKSSKFEENIPFSLIEIELKPEEKVTLYKFITYIWGNKINQNLEKLHNEFVKNGFEKNCTAQENFLKEFWKIAEIKIEGDKESEEALQFNLFHLLQSAGRNGKVSIAAKGLTSEGYEGHFFWDTESYVCPVFTYTAPEVAKKLLEYRASILDKAINHAKELNLKGALYPWRTIDGEETSAYYPAGTAQVHIDADIIFALNRYLNAHEEDFGFDEKAVQKMCAETARMYMSRGDFNPRKNNQFCINDVTGPDEYTAIVNNNAFTNLMARENLEISAKRAKEEASEKEKAEWNHAAQNMYIPFDKETGIYPQDDSFLDKPDWDFKNTPESNYPLLLHYHPLEIYRHRVLKQPDLVLAQFLMSGRFSKAEKIRNFNFYEKYTTGDSSLSHCIMSIMACETGDVEKAFNYFNQTVRMDIDDVNGNSSDGIHTACMAGSWMSTIYGFAGFRDYDGIYSFDPKLPEKWTELKFNMEIKGCTLNVEITKENVTYTLTSGENLSLVHRNKKFRLCKNESKSFSLKRKLGAVLFDLDGVITNTAPLHYKAWKKLSDDYNLKFNEEMNKKLLGVSREESCNIILKENKVIWPEERKARFCEKKNELYKVYLNDISEKDILPGIKNLLEELKQNNIPALLASSSKNAPFILEKLGLSEYFTAIADANKIQKAKPEPDIFLEAAENSGEWYCDCVGIEDAESGIESIKKGSMAAIGVSPDLSLKKADFQVRTTSDLNLKLIKVLMEK